MNAADAADRREGHAESPSKRYQRQVVVEDDGPGIDASIQERFRTIVTTKEVGKGTGLGLAVCRGLVESARGTIRLDESFQPGARFVVDLPIAG